MREKYVEERFPQYMIFGEYEDGFVDVASVNDDIVTHVSREDAQRLIQERSNILDMLVTLALAFDEAAPDTFSQIWYGGR